LVGSGTTAVFNLAAQKIHVPFIVDRTCDATTHGAGTACAGSAEADPINIGVGSDGPFDATTLTRFDTNHGSVAGTITLDSSRDYQFTTFDLPAGYTIRGSGTRPLVIRVQGDITVDGVIDVSGGNG